VNLILLTQPLGPSDPLLAFVPTWIEHLAERVAHLWVITPRAEEMAWPQNVTVCEVGRDYEAGETILHAVKNFHEVMWRLTRDETIDGIFTHMLPKFTILAAPYAKLRGIPLIMWYTHKNVDWKLRLAGVLADRIVTASRETCQLDTSKVTPIGHGIDTGVFQPAKGEEKGTSRPTIVAVGRISPIKHLEVVIEAAGILVHQRGFDELEVILAGAPPNPGQVWYLEELRELTRERQLEGHVTFAGVVPYGEIVSLYQRGDVFVSASRSGVDKVVLEAMACGTPVVVSDPVFEPMLEGRVRELMYRPGDAQALTRRLEALLAMPARERDAVGRELRDIVVRSHAVGVLMDKLLRTFEESA
jgi:glycosyltransferase involved in cell wall biosynthesis